MFHLYALRLGLVDLVDLSDKNYRAAYERQTIWDVGAERIVLRIAAIIFMERVFQIDLVSMTAKKYDVSLVVDIEGVGEEIASLPLLAK